MAAIFTSVKGARGGAGTVREEFFDVTFDAAYATGGVAVDSRSAGFLTIFGISEIASGLVAGTAKTSKYLFDYDQNTGKIQFFGQDGTTGALVEMANSVALSTLKRRVRITGV
jgi:hypothetical protein